MTVNSPLLDGTQITNVAMTNWTNATTGEPEATTSTVAGTVGAPDLRDQQITQREPDPGADVTYTIDVSNIGDRSDRRQFHR